MLQKKGGARGTVIVPHTGVHIDTTWRRLATAAFSVVCTSRHPDAYVASLRRLFTTPLNPNPVLPILSVRSGLDLFLSARRFPPGSEVIVSALNIPDMVHILHAHRLVVVALDISVATLAPRLELFDALVTPRTVAVLVAHLFGRWFDTDAVIAAAARHRLAVIEDCAEAFCGLHLLGDPRADLSLFSFGVIKHQTAFGGAVAKIRDPAVAEEMTRRLADFPRQSRADYLLRLAKYSVVHLCLDCPPFMTPALTVLRALGIQPRDHLVRLLRGFPDQLTARLRHRPSAPLLRTLAHHLGAALALSAAHRAETCDKAQYVARHLPPTVRLIGQRTLHINHWLYPIVVEDARSTSAALYRLGVEAYHGVTQLGVVLSDRPSSPDDQPHEARFLIEHILYLPVNRNVRYRDLDRICVAVGRAVAPSGFSDDWCAPYARSLVRPPLLAKL